MIRSLPACCVEPSRKGDSVYAFALERPKGSTFTIPRVRASDGMKVQVVGGGSASYTQKGRDLGISAPGKLPGEYAVAVKLTPALYQLVRD